MTEYTTRRVARYFSPCAICGEQVQKGKPFVFVLGQSYHEQCFEKRTAERLAAERVA